MKWKVGQTGKFTYKDWDNEYQFEILEIEEGNVYLQLKGLTNPHYNDKLHYNLAEMKLFARDFTKLEKALK